jgi:hypothetical protein
VLPSVDPAGAFPRLSGALRSSHALLALILVLAFLFYLLGRSDPLVSRGAFVVFVAVTLVVLYRFFSRGPEQDRAQSSVAVGPNEARFNNVDLPQELVRAVLTQVLSPPKPLPLPTGVIKGSASDPAAIQILSVDAAKDLMVADNTGRLLNTDTDEIESGASIPAEKARQGV